MWDERNPDCNFLNRKPLLRVHALTCLRRGSADIIARHPDGLLLFERVGQVHFLCADTKDAVRALLKMMPQVPVMVSDLHEMDEWIMKERGFTGRTVCTNVVYLKREPVQIDTELALRPLPPEAAKTVSALYSLHDPDTIEGFIAEGRLLGGYLKDELVGFTGWHEEGAMGMLHVFEPYRRKGYAYAMEALQINLTLARGELPHGQVIQGNGASLALQKKLGFTAAEGTVSWLFSDRE